jgi:hypothetical protein
MLHCRLAGWGFASIFWLVCMFALGIRNRSNAVVSSVSPDSNTARASFHMVGLRQGSPSPLERFAEDRLHVFKRPLPMHLFTYCDNKVRPEGPGSRSLEETGKATEAGECSGEAAESGSLLRLRGGGNRKSRVGSSAGRGGKGGNGRNGRRGRGGTNTATKGPDERRESQIAEGTADYAAIEPGIGDDTGCDGDAVQNVDLNTPIRWAQKPRKSESVWSRCQASSSGGLHSSFRGAWKHGGAVSSVGLEGGGRLPPDLGRRSESLVTLDDAIQEFDAWVEDKRKRGELQWDTHSSEDLGMLSDGIGNLTVNDASTEGQNEERESAGECAEGEPRGEETSLDASGKDLRGGSGLRKRSLFAFLRGVLVPEGLVMAILKRLENSYYMYKETQSDASMVQWAQDSKTRTDAYKATLLWVLTLFFQEVWGFSGGLVDGQSMDGDGTAGDSNPAGGTGERSEADSIGSGTLQGIKDEQIGSMMTSEWQLPWTRNPENATILMVVGMSGVEKTACCLQLAHYYTNTLQLRSVVIGINSGDAADPALFRESIFAPDTSQGYVQTAPEVIILDAPGLRSDGVNDSVLIQDMVSIAAAARPLHTYIVVDGGVPLSDADANRLQQMCSALDLSPPSGMGTREERNIHASAVLWAASHGHYSAKARKDRQSAALAHAQGTGSQLLPGSNFNYSILVNARYGPAKGSIYDAVAVAECGVSLICTGQGQEDIEVFSPPRFVLQLLQSFSEMRRMSSEAMLGDPTDQWRVACGDLTGQASRQVEGTGNGAREVLSAVSNADGGAGIAVPGLGTCGSSRSSSVARLAASAARLMSRKACGEGGHEVKKKVGADNGAATAVGGGLGGKRRGLPCGPSAGTGVGGRVGGARSTNSMVESMKDNNRSFEVVAERERATREDLCIERIAKVCVVMVGACTRFGCTHACA